MATIDYADLAVKCKEQIEATGRQVTISKLSAALADNAKPWRGAAAQTKVNPVVTSGVFVVPNTSIPTESRGLGLDWVDQELLKRARRVCIVPAKDLPDLENYHVVTDGSKDFAVLWVQCLQPGSVRLLYVFGFAQ